MELYDEEHTKPFSKMSYIMLCWHANYIGTGSLLETQILLDYLFI